jgi:hypothetical protein
MRRSPEPDKPLRHSVQQVFWARWDPWTLGPLLGPLAPWPLGPVGDPFGQFDPLDPFGLFDPLDRLAPFDLALRTVKCELVRPRVAVSRCFARQCEARRGEVQV